jgi:hypothetical protein
MGLEQVSRRLISSTFNRDQVSLADGASAPSQILVPPRDAGQLANPRPAGGRRTHEERENAS